MDGYSQSTYSFYEKLAILLVIYLSDQELGPIFCIVDTGLNIWYAYQTVDVNVVIELASFENAISYKQKHMSAGFK